MQEQERPSLTRYRLEHLSHCRMLPGSYDKRFVRSLLSGDTDKLSERQLAEIARLDHRYRRQLPRI